MPRPVRYNTVRYNTDAVTRDLERRVLAGDLSLVPALAAAYQRAGQPLEVWILDFTLAVPDYPYWREFSAYASRSGALTAAADIIENLLAEHFYDPDYENYFAEIRRALTGGDVFSAIEWHKSWVHVFWPEADESDYTFDVTKHAVNP